MTLRKTHPGDGAAVAAFARQHRMDYEGMEKDDFWIAEEDGRILGIVGLKRHPDCLELLSLCVATNRRKSGVGASLVRAAVGEARGPIHLATVLPGFFERLGFEKTSRIPGGMKKDPSWCEGCDRSLCTVMVGSAG
ncbi:MAG: GNAT family N-acetyltransferase [Candidatus Aminicenantales bacterium]